MARPTIPDFPPFPGFRDEGLQFLRDLKRNNKRDWFKPRKETFKDEVEWPLRCLVMDAGRRALAEDLPLSGDPKKALFRIYRDTRFSKNKRPYKTHASAVLSRNGTRKDSGVVYIHIEPGASFLGAGYWKPENTLLKAWRSEMIDRPALFLDILSHLEERGLELADGPTLKRMPRGFHTYADSELAPYLKRKSFTVTRPVTDEQLSTPAFTDDVLAFSHDVLPLLAYGWDLLRVTPS